MKKPHLIHSFLILLLCMLAAASCNKSDDSTSNTPTETPLIKEGQIVNSDFYVNDVLREQLIDSVVNLGGKEMPALFYIRQQHTLDGAPLILGNHHSNVFRSLTRGEHYIFIVLWGKLMGMNLNTSDTSLSARQKVQLAFFELQSYLMSNDIDFPLLVALAQDSSELVCAKRWVDAASKLSASGVKLSESNTPNYIFRALEIKGIKASELSKAAKSAGMSEEDFLLMAQNTGTDVEHSLIQFGSPKQVVVCLVALGIKMAVSWGLRFIKHGSQEPGLSDKYASYLHDADSNVMNYIHRKDTTSPTYKVAYCTLATAAFKIETYYDAYHRTMAGQYINRVGMIVTSVHCSWGMHVDGTTVFDVGHFSGPSDNPIAYSTGTVTIKYGDCCCYARVGTLKFEVTGDNGYKQTSWDPSK